MKMKGLYIALQHILILFASPDSRKCLFILQIVPKVEQLLSYDTTFSMVDFYVSTVLFKYGIIEESPVVPAWFLNHEHKFQSHHQHLFEILRRYCKTNLKNVALATDMEMGFVNAAEAETTLKVVGCWRHLKKVIERYVHDNEGKRQDAFEFISNDYKILRNENDIEKMTHDMKATCNPQLKHYLKKQTEPYRIWNLVILTPPGIN